MWRKVILVSLFLSGWLAVSAGYIEKPKLEPAESTEVQGALIREGVRLHELGKYEEAVKKYQEVLDESPHNVIAMYEMAYSYFKNGELEKSLEVARRGTRYKSPLLVEFYLSIANTLDELGKPKDAVKVYKKAVRRFPDHQMLRYNMGITLLRLGKTDEGQETFEEGIRIDSTHPTSHMVLNQIYEIKGQVTPAILAGSRFLILEPDSERSGTVLSSLQNLWGLGVEKEADDKINIFLDPESLDDPEGIGALDMMLKFQRAGRHMKLFEGKSEMELVVGDYESILQMIVELEEEKRGNGFFWEYYAKYFGELHKAGHTKAFVYHIFQGADMEGVSTWLRDHYKEHEAFLRWNEEEGSGLSN